MFELLSTSSFPSRKLVAKRFRHECGLEVLSLEAQDPENLFAVYFPTDPKDDTGSAHIIEHSVLGGSARFPVKDPFISLYKTSIATFLNALTYPDRTVYPFITCCPKDYFNILEVYWDAVFHPLITPDVLAQEGWHYEISGTGRSRKLKVNGIVHNEMSGYYSSPTTILSRSMEKALFPNTSLRFDSGGVPEKIPALSYPKFLQFYLEHYNPAIARVVMYGDIPTEEKLAVLERHLREDLGEGPYASEIHIPSTNELAGKVPVKRPRVVRETFVPDPESKKKGTGMVSVAWALDDTRDTDLDLGVQLLEAVLLGNEAAPLRKALIESGIATTPLSSGYDNETKYTSFCVSMGGVAPKNFSKFESLVLDVLRTCVRDGIPKDKLESALTSFQTQNQLIDRDYVFDLLEDVIAAWKYSPEDPFLFLRQEEQLPQLQETLRKNPRYLEDLIQKWLLDNPRRVRVELRPDSHRKERDEKALADRLARKLSTWSEKRITQALSLQQRLRENAQRVDTPEAMATIPVLQRGDLPSRVPALRQEDGRFANGLRYRKSTDFTDGIDRLSFWLDCASIPADLTPYFDCFTGLFGKMGTRTMTYDQAANEWATTGGAFNIALSSSLDREDPDFLRYGVTITVSALERHFPKAIDLLKKRFLEIAFGERKRLKQLLGELLTRSSLMLQRRDNFLLASARASEGLRPMTTFQNVVGGIGAYRLIQKLGRLKENELDDLADKMMRLAQWLLTVPVFAAGLATQNRDSFAAMESLTSLWTPERSICSATPLLTTVPQSTLSLGRSEYCVVPARVHTCVRAFAAPFETSKAAVPLMMASQILKNGYLWDEIRAKGGAYGCSMSFKSRSGIALLSAHEDPNCEKTYQVFETLPRLLRKDTPFTKEAVERTAIQMLGPILTPVRPSTAAQDCLTVLFDHFGDAERQQRYEEIQGVTRKQVQSAAEELFAQGHNDCALGPAPAPASMVAFQLG